MNWQDDFLPLVLPYLPGCPESIAVEHLIQSARVFARKSLAWNYELPLITTTLQSDGTTPTANYFLPLGADEMLVKVLSVDVNGCLYYPLNDGSLSRRIVRDQCGGRIAQVIKSDPSITITPTVSSGQAIFAQVAVMPTSDTDSEWPDSLEEYAKDIAAGAIATLAMMPKKTWSDTSTAAIQEAFFNDRCSTIYHQVAKTLIPTRTAAHAVYF